MSQRLADNLVGVESRPSSRQLPSLPGILEFVLGFAVLEAGVRVVLWVWRLVSASYGRTRVAPRRRGGSLVD